MTYQEIINAVKYSSHIENIITRIFDKIPNHWINIKSMQKLLNFLNNETKI